MHIITNLPYLRSWVKSQWRIVFEVWRSSRSGINLLGGGVVKLFNTQNKLMDVHQSDISKILRPSASNFVSFIFIKSGWSPDHFHDTVQDLVRWSNSARKSGCSSSIVAPKVWAASAKCALPPSSMCTSPNFLMTSIPRRRSNPNGLLFTTSTFVFKGLLLVTVKVMLTTPWLKRYFLLAVRIAVLFHTLDRRNIPLTTDEEQTESTNANRSIPLTFTFITGSTSSSLCGERVVPASRPLPNFPRHFDATCPCCWHW